MIPDLPTDPRQALEASLTALLLGELPPEQAAFLERTVAQDPELSKQLERLKRTIELVRETGIASSDEPTASVPARPKLSRARRQELLQQFKTVAPKEFKRRPWHEMRWLMPTAVAACIVALLGLTFTGTFRAGSSRLNPPSRRLREAVQLAQNKRDETEREQLHRFGFTTGAKENVRAWETQTSASAAAPAPSSTLSARTEIVLPSQLQFDGFSPDGKAGNRQVADRLQILSPFQKDGDVSKGILFGRDVNSVGDSVTGVIGGLGGEALDRSKLQQALRNSGSPGNEQAPALLSELPPSEARFQYDITAIGGLAKNEIQDSLLKPAIQQSTEQTIPKLGDSPRVGGLFGGPQDSRQETDESRDLARRALPLWDQASGLDLAWNDVALREPATEQNLEARQTNVAESKTGQLEEATRADDGLQNQIAGQSVAKEPAKKAKEEILSLAAADADKERFWGEFGKTVTGTVEKQTRGGPGDAKAASTDTSGTTIAPDYAGSREQQKQLSQSSLGRVEMPAVQENQKVVQLERGLNVGTEANNQQDLPTGKPIVAAPIAQPEVLVRENAFSTFSLNVSDVSFKLTAASLEKGNLPQAGSVRAEEFINAFDYRDPEPAPGVPVAFAWERARYPFAQNRDLLRLSIKTAATGRQTDRPLNIVLLLDNSGSMERADRVAILHEALRVLATQLHAQDTLSVVTFARTARLWVDGVPGNQAGQLADQVRSLTPQGGTNLEEAMALAYQTALRHYLPSGINRVVLLTDGAANLGEVNPDALKTKAEANRRQGIALDCFGIGWEGYNDDLLETLARNSDGRYGFLNSPAEAAAEFAGQLAGALQVAASDVKVQVQFNPNRVQAYRQVGYAKHQLTKQQFRDNTVNAAQLGAAESGNALYVVDCNAAGQGSIATVRVRYRVPGTAEYREQEWAVPYDGSAVTLQKASPTIRLAASAAAFAEWLSSNPYASEVTPGALLDCLQGLPELSGADPRPKQLEWMLRQAKSITGK